MNPNAPAEPPHYTVDGPYRGAEPAFYAAHECHAARVLEARWREIRDELERELRAGVPTLTRNFDPYGYNVRGWKTANLMTYGWRDTRNCQRFARIAAIVRSIPHVTSAFVNALEPGTLIPMHEGDSNAIQRCHLGLVVPPPEEDCGIEVGGERRRWEEGATLVFCDAHPHRAWNLSDQVRVILVVDVLRPPYVRQRYRICGNVLAAIGLTLVDTRFGITRRLRPWQRRTLHRSLGAMVACVLRFREAAYRAHVRMRPASCTQSVPDPSL